MPRVVTARTQLGCLCDHRRLVATRDRRDDAVGEAREQAEGVTSPFPDSPRVVYRKNPLELVICQLRFPAILRIGSEPPAAFQEAIRAEYPLFREVASINVPSDVPPEVATLVRNLGAGAPGTYDFLSADEQWSVGLTRDFVALTSRSYTRWEEFRARLKSVIDVVVDEYSPPFFTRVGLRYQDAICPISMELGERDWRKLISPYILGELSVEAVANAAAEATRTLVMRVPGGTVRIRHGLGERRDTNESCYIIDADFFTDERTGVNEAIQTLAVFNRNAGRFYRWCITDKLHDALGPDPA